MVLHMNFEDYTTDQLREIADAILENPRLREDLLGEIGARYQAHLDDEDAIARIEERDAFRNDVEADADALASAGFGDDEDYYPCNESDFDE